MQRVKLIVMTFGAFWAFLYVTLYLWKSYGYRHPDNKVANALVAVS